MGTFPKRFLLRRAGSNRTGESFDPQQVQMVWNKARLAPGYDPRVRRLDACGAYIDRAKYGDTASDTGTGWEIDHIRPVSLGGTDDLVNLQPLQWKNNRRKSDSFPSSPSQYAAVVAAGN
jgi:hypothetical protein